ncbi:MAG: TetR/AcrR family transcriptional regulator [Burkholderia contaminans]|jgi:AcrR family transcriptional regulator|uniref:TetR/AcrR family transcriptional regulator n=2 Tax=Burkholderia contaminans TaxID=488447 RepID=A0AAP4R3N4_9BURK|nr:MULTISPECIES: TetR/AcrR family transcriptional regulator [Burkholderia]MBD1414639.1 TetR/AcrR family transcriptional regulator [Burkholderia contaminans]MBH9667140.1 TetR/AcrR family transcriptional regulator [Burkholderia contaminans]MBH9673311.1 TetR/AcrR family transcriptional regulator [Burkholderia contaminans]MBH9703354.1 TetR/AcrR family transcriptional regulator [Burkholderia contaminans]MBH9721293.1 TetR/AcrR family transcriptional regulator [Burkholderia contaminans]
MSTRVSEAAAAMRKAPRQARSRATVDVIVTAGARVLDTHGWAGFTTNEVAEVAGVSIGSVYQYFPNKLALVDAIRRRHFDDVLAVLQRAHDRQASPRRLVERLIADLIAVHRDYPSLHRALLDLPDPGGVKAVYDAFQKEYLHRYALVVAACRGRPSVKADAMTAQVLSSALEGIVHNAARRGLLDDPKLKRELVRLACGYLEDPRDGATRARE